MQYILLAQTAMGAVAGGVVGMMVVLWCAAIICPIVFLACWYSTEIFQLISDLIHSRDLLEESEFDRQMEGRLFVPEHRPQRARRE